jgi:hypothetical protein
MFKELKPTDPNYPRFVQLNTELTALRRAMRLLKQERETLLTGQAPTRRPTPALGVPVGPPPAAQPVFSPAPAGAPRVATAPPTSAIHGDLATMVRSTFEKNPGVLYTSASMASAVGVGTALQRPVANAIKGLLREKVVTEVTRNKYAHLVLQEAPTSDGHTSDK